VPSKNTGSISTLCFLFALFSNTQFNKKSRP